MPIKKEFAGYHKISGERVMKVYNPLGFFSAYVVENGDTPYSGQTVTAGDIQAEPLTSAKEIVEEQPEAFVPDTPEMLRSVELMQEVNDRVLGGED